MARFWISLFFSLAALALFWGVLHWVRYKKRPGACTCGTGACLTEARRPEPGQPRHPPGEDGCDGGSCRCPE